MNKYTNVLDPHAEATLRSTIGAISGVAIKRLTAEPMKKGGTSIDVRIRVWGWSPSLNLVKMSWRAAVPETAPAEQGATLLEAFAQHIAIQRRRAAEGLALGTAAPFGMCDLNGGRSDTQWRHILVDARLAVLLEESREEGFDRESTNALFDVHNPEEGSHDGLEDEYEAEVDDDDCNPIEGLHHGVRGRVLFLDTPVGDGSYDGFRLRLPRTLPDTLLSAAVGRRLGEIVDVPIPLRDLVVTEALNTEEGIHLGIQPDLVEAGRLLDGFARHDEER